MQRRADQTNIRKQTDFTKQYKMFQQILDQADDIPDYEICLAYGFRENTIIGTKTKLTQ